MPRHARHAIWPHLSPHHRPPPQPPPRSYRRLLSVLGKERLPGAVVANKVDLHERAVIERGAGQHMAADFGLCYFEASAKDGDGVDAPFQHVAAELLKLTDVSEAAEIAQDL